jgi:Holliday junction resolvase RusA-like endonuclease
MPDFVLVVEGDPVPKQRPRIGKGKAYTPQRTQVYQELVGWAARMTMVGQRCTMFTQPVAVEMTFYYGNHGADLDNLVKAVWDGLNGVVWQDDVLVEEMNARVYRGCPKDERQVSIRVRSLE